MRRIARGVVRQIINVYLVLKFVMNQAGAEYGISAFRRLSLAIRFIRNNRKIKSLSSWQQHLLLAEELLRVPRSLEGDVVECGCYSGASTANLSLACQLVNRKLFVCDSFEGLPAPREDEKYTLVGESNEYYHWQEGEFAPERGFDQVRENVEKFGKIEVCEFVKGFFQDTLKDLDSNSLVLVFEDADLVSSVEDCLKHLWPKLQDGCRFYSHEPFSFEVMALFFDYRWWQEHLDSDPPGFVGSGAGLSVWGIGYARKVSKENVLQHGRQLFHLGSRGFEAG